MTNKKRNDIINTTYIRMWSNGRKEKNKDRRKP